MHEVLTDDQDLGWKRLEKTGRIPDLANSHPPAEQPDKGLFLVADTCDISPGPTPSFT